jgi:hypothetical protein
LALVALAVLAQPLQNQIVAAMVGHIKAMGRSVQQRRVNHLPQQAHAVSMKLVQ